MSWLPCPEKFSSSRKTWKSLKKRRELHKWNSSRSHRLEMRVRGQYMNVWKWKMIQSKKGVSPDSCKSLICHDRFLMILYPIDCEKCSSIDAQWMRRDWKFSNLNWRRLVIQLKNLTRNVMRWVSLKLRHSIQDPRLNCSLLIDTQSSLACQESCRSWRWFGARRGTSTDWRDVRIVI